MLKRDIEDNIKTEVLFDETLFVVAGNESKWARRRKIDLSDLANESWIISPADTVVTSLLREAFRASNLEPPRAAVVTVSLQMRNTLLATGRFLTAVPGSMLRFSKNPQFKALPVKLGAPRRPVAVMTLKNRTLSPAAILFIETARVLVSPKAD